MRHAATARALHLLVLAAACVRLGADDAITVFAAASTTGPLQAAAKAYEAEQHVRVVCSFAASSTLAKQIGQGAPADVFLAADEQWMDWLAKRGAIAPASRVDLLGNSLVLIAPPGTAAVITVAKDFAIGSAFTGRLAIGDPSNVPAGIYAKEAFTTLGWWDALATRLAPAADVRAALRLVELGEAELGVVYATDARADAKVVTIAAIPPDLHAPIRYPLALTATAKPAAAAFAAWLRGAAARRIFTDAGFSVPGATAP
jgi:molybdate transport system substrate-binding protein